MKFSGTHRKCIEYLTALVPLIVKIKQLQWVNGRVMKFRGTYCNAQYWYLRLFFFIFFRHLFRKCNGSFAPRPHPPFVMTQINEIKWNRLPKVFYAFPMSTANLHSSRKCRHDGTWHYWPTACCCLVSYVAPWGVATYRRPRPLLVYLPLYYV